LKHRENTKLDCEKYNKRVEHAEQMESRSMKEEAALAGQEANIGQA
jgi:hypothetical protein